MEVTRIKPQGYCNGVMYALAMLDDILAKPETEKPIYLLGQIIHNKQIMNKYLEKGVIILDDPTKTKLELLDSISRGTVVFSAHGVAPDVYQKALMKKLNIVDATCVKVKKIHDLITTKIANGYDIIYIGTKNHPECEGMLNINKDRIHLVTKLSDIESLHLTNEKLYVTNQTTLSQFDLADIHLELKSKYQNLEIEDSICNATSLRQTAMANQKKVDLCIVVGDKSSSNTKKLVDVSNNKAHIKTILIETLKDLDLNLLKDIKTISVSSGASTPKEITDEVISFLENYQG